MKNNNEPSQNNSQRFVDTFRLKFLKYLIAVLFAYPVVAFGQEYSSYTIFENFEIMAPGTPTEMVKNTMYGSKDDVTGTAILITKGSSGLEFDIGEYNLAIKKMMDDSLIQGEEFWGDIVTRFSSDFDRKRNRYTAIYFVSPKELGSRAYAAKKRIIKGKDKYTWVVTSYDKDDVEMTFEKYKNLIK